MEGGALVPVYPKRTVARLLPEPKKRLRPITKEIGIQASLSRAMVPWVPSPVSPAAVLPSPALPPPISRQMLMPPPPAPPLLPTSSSTALAFYRQTPPPPPQSRVFTMTQESKELSNSKELIPVDPRRSATPTQEENKEEDADVVILEPNDPPAWKLLKIYFPSKKKKSRRSSSRTSSEHDSSRCSRSSKTLSPSRRSHGKSKSSDKPRPSRKHKSSHRKSSRHHKSRRGRSHSSTRVSSKTKRHHRQVKTTDKVIPVVMLSDSPAEPDRESNRCPSSSNSEAIKRVRTKDVKGCTEIFDSSRRQWPEPARESERHPVRIINCYHVLREKKLMPVVDLTARSPPRERMTKEHENLKTCHVPTDS